MGEKGNISSEELVAAGSGAVVAGAGTQVTAVFEDAAGIIKNKVLDMGAGAGITMATETWQQRRADGSEDPADPSTSS